MYKDKGFVTLDIHCKGSMIIVGRDTDLVNYLEIAL